MELLSKLEKNEEFRVILNKLPVKYRGNLKKSREI